MPSQFLPAVFEGPSLRSPSWVGMNVQFGDRWKEIRDRVSLGDHERIAAERMGHAELKGHVGIEVCKIDKHVSTAAQLRPDTAQDVWILSAIAAEILCRPSASSLCDAFYLIRPGFTEGHHMEAAQFGRIVGRPPREEQLRSISTFAVAMRNVFANPIVILLIMIAAAYGVYRLTEEWIPKLTQLKEQMERR